MNRKTIIRIALGFAVGFSLLTAWHYVSECYIFKREVMPMKYYMIKAAVPVSFTFLSVFIAGTIRAKKARKQEQNNE